MNSINSKINRALDLFEGINNEYAEWKNLTPYKTITECNDERTTFILGVKFTLEPPVTKWSLIIGEILFNLRCALDHLVYNLAVSDSQINPPHNEKKLMFPVSEKEVDFEKSVKRGLLRGLNQENIDFIKSVQPFNSSIDTNLHPLAVLSKLNNIDKHRYLQIAVFSVAESQAYLKGFNPGMIKISINDKPLGMEDWIMSFESPRPIAGPEGKLRFKIRLGLSEKNFQDKEILMILKECIDNVINIAKPYQPSKKNRSNAAPV